MPGPVGLTSQAAARPGPGVQGGSRTASRPAELGPTELGPVSRLGHRLQTLDPEEPHRYAVTDLSGSVLEADWRPVSGIVSAMVACAGEHLAVSPGVAGARMAGSLGYAVAGRLAVALAVSGQAYDVSPDSLMLRLDDSGLVERIGVRNPVLAAPAADSSVGPGPGPVLRLTNLDAVIVWAADRAWTTLAPLIDEVHEMTRYGRMPMWNLVADTVLGPTTLVPRLAGLDQRAGRAAGSAFLDALVDRGAPIHRRGTVREQAGSEVLLPIRGSCCLHFRLTQEKCATCPLTSLADVGPEKACAGADVDLGSRAFPGHTP